MTSESMVIICTLLVGFLSMLISFWTAHSSNVKRIQTEAERWARLDEKVDRLERWFESNWEAKSGIRGQWQDATAKDV